MATTSTSVSSSGIVSEEDSSSNKRYSTSSSITTASSSGISPKSIPPPLPPKPSTLRRQSISMKSDLSSFASLSSSAAPPLPKRDNFNNNNNNNNNNNSYTHSMFNSSRSSTTNKPSSSLTSSASSLFLSSFNPASNKLKEIGGKWSKKGKERLQEGWNRRNSSPVSLAALASGSGSNLPTTLIGNASSGIKLPCKILGLDVPNKMNECFGIPLADAVRNTRIRQDEMEANRVSGSNSGTRRRVKDMDEIRGEDAKRWLPSIAYRCLEYLELWGQKGEEGLYRIPGRSHQIAQLRALFDSGLDLDLREIHPGDLDPHAVASLFKSWLREIPESLLSPQLESAIDSLVQDSTGFSATSTQFLGHHSPDATKMVNGQIPPALLDQLKDIFAGGMPAENFFLLRGICFHLSRLEENKEKTKMTLANLRLILSPTLRLSPHFLSILVERADILFSKPNESARSREIDFYPNSSPLIPTPSSATSSRFPSQIARTSTSNSSTLPTSARVLPPPFLQRIETPSSHRMSSRSSSSRKSETLPPHIWLQIDESLLDPEDSTTRTNSTSNTIRSGTRTPIADKFVSPILNSTATFSDLTNDNTSRKSRDSISLDRSVSRNRNIVNNSNNVGNGFAMSRNLSSSSSSSKPSNPSSSSFPYSPSSTFYTNSNPSKSTSRTTTPTALGNSDSTSILNPQRYSSESFMSKNGGLFEVERGGDPNIIVEGEYLRRFSRPVPSVSLPDGFGLGLEGSEREKNKEEEEEEESGFGLLSVEERKKFFSR